MSLLKEGRGSTGVYSSVSEADVFFLLMGGLAAAFWGATCSRCSAIMCFSLFTPSGIPAYVLLLESEHRQRRGEGLETHCVYVCTLAVIGVFLFDNFLPLFWRGNQL